MKNIKFCRVAVFIIFMGSLIPRSSSEPQGKPNHLIHEKSPYLQQHAYNPVDWYPWGDEAFQKARRENKPIFLSIGYSTCHWCHVMERESFSDPKIAAVMNKLFVSIKVDREERPDVDKIYITAVSAMTGGAGWPLSVWLTPDLKPFYGGTYFPPDSRWGRPGFQDVLLSLAKTWQEDREKAVASGNDLTKRIKAYLDGEARKGALDETAFANGIKSFGQSYESSKGGFGGAPKFPMPGNHNFLFRAWNRTKDQKALDMSLNTLREMAKGGIYDHIGGGFHRYSTDAKWHIPHFEKMLYDNAQLAVNYLEAYQITKEEDFARVAKETLEYVRRDMTHPQGGFYSAEDADSLPPELAGKVSDKGHEHKTEGAFYLWEKDEVTKILGERNAEIYNYRYGAESSGNAGSDPHGEFKNKNILYAAHGIKETAKKFGMSEKETAAKLLEARQKLFAVRAKRPRPHLDDKILVSWNGLMISAFAKAGQIFGDPAYSKAAERAAGFIRSNLYDAKTKTLSRRWREGESKIPGIADDYAFLTQGLLDLYEATFDVAWLEWAIDLTETQNKLFYDAENGGFYMTSSGHDKNLLIRTKEDSDNVEPAASSVAALNLLRLAQFTDRDDFRKAAEKTLSLFAEQMKQQPRSLPQMLVALDYFMSKPKQIILAGERGSPDTKAMLSEIQKRFIPNKMVLVAEQGTSREILNRLLPFLKGIVPINKKATAYVCIDYACKLPTNDLNTFADILSGKR